MSDARLAIVGSRTMTDRVLFTRRIDEWIAQHGAPAIIITGTEGAAKGADSMACDYARENRIALRVHAAQWSKYGKRAGPLRNTIIVEDCTHVVAFPSVGGSGTQDTLRKATLVGKHVTVHAID